MTGKHRKQTAIRRNAVPQAPAGIGAREEAADGPLVSGHWWRGPADWLGCCLAVAAGLPPGRVGSTRCSRFARTLVTERAVTQRDRWRDGSECWHRGARDAAGSPGVSGRQPGDAASVPPAAPAARIPPAGQPAGPGAPLPASSPGLGGDAPGGAGHPPVAGHCPQAAGEHDHKGRHHDQGDIGHDPGEQQPDADHEPQRRCGHPALVAHPRVGRRYGVSKPRVIGAEPLLDLLEQALLVLRERHGALRWNPGGRPLLLPGSPLSLPTCACRPRPREESLVPTVS